MRGLNFKFASRNGELLFMQISHVEYALLKEGRKEGRNNDYCC